MKQADGTWRGISIELWRALAAELQVTYELRERDWQGLLDGVAVGVLIWFFERKRNPLLPDVFEHQTYGFALPSNSPLREDLNRVLLGQLQQPTWQDILYRYLGKPSDQATVP
jgi:ABC-type amino acid transport substrate-binding protein